MIAAADKVTDRPLRPGEIVLWEADGARVTALRERTPEGTWLHLAVWERSIDSVGREGPWRRDLAGVSLPPAGVEALRRMLCAGSEKP